MGEQGGIIATLTAPILQYSHIESKEGKEHGEHG